MLLSLVAPARAGEPLREPETVTWREEWPRFRPWQYAATGAALAGATYFVLFVDYPASGNPARNPFDDAARDLLRARTRAGRDRARTVGDIGYRGLFLYPFVDTLLVGGLVHGSGDVAVQTSLLNLQAFAFTGVLALGTLRTVGRSRPSSVECAENPDYEVFCGLPDQHAAFFTGHVTIAFAGAGLTCAHHQALPLYGGGAPDVAACVLATSLATATGIARVVNDRHWMSEALLGAAVGGLGGYALPMALHYTADSNGKDRHGGFHWTLLPFANASSRTLGIQWIAQ